MVIKTPPKYVDGIANVYPSEEAKGFADREKYPVALELIFTNNQAGKELAANLSQAFSELPKSRGYLLPQKCTPDDPTRCFEGVFKDAASLGKVLNTAFGNEIAFVDEQKKAVVPRFELVEEAKAIAAGKAFEMAY